MYLYRIYHYRQVSCELTWDLHVSYPFPRLSAYRVVCYLAVKVSRGGKKRFCTYTVRIFPRQSLS